jgi:hypothetical protein
MVKDNDIFKKDILIRVKRAYFYRTYLRPAALHVSALGALVGVSAFFISVKDVLVNAYHVESMQGFSSFVYSAFMGTELSVKIITISAGIVGVIFITHCTKSVSHMYTKKSA